MRSKRRTVLFKTVTGLFFVYLIIFIDSKISEAVEISNSKKAVELNQAINNRNMAYARGNPFGFTDKIRAIKKPKGVYRIAVLGDSFVWGDGLPYEKIWSHKLENKLLQEYDSIELMSWGHDGWSTLDEFNFYRRTGKDFNIDLLIIGWVDNDPDMGKISMVPVGNPGKRFPNVYKIWPAMARVFQNMATGDSYNRWLNEIYGGQNLQNYQILLNDFHRYLVEHNTSVLVVMTPAQLDEHTRERFDKAKPLIIKAGFPCLNLYAPCKEKLGQYSQLQLQANPANAHPGDLMTGLFAAETENYLKQNGFLTGVRKKSL